MESFINFVKKHPNKNEFVYIISEFEFEGVKFYDICGISKKFINVDEKYEMKHYFGSKEVEISYERFGYDFDDRGYSRSKKINMYEYNLTDEFFLKENNLKIPNPNSIEMKIKKIEILFKTATKLFNGKIIKIRKEIENLRGSMEKATRNTINTTLENIKNRLKPFSE